MQVHAIENDKIQYTKKDTVSFFAHFIIRSLLYALITVVACGLTLFLIIVGDTVYNFSKGNNMVPLFGGYVIISPSMVPTIKVKDAVIVKRTSQDNLNIGDIITFKSTDPRYTGLIITHRIVGTQSISSGDLVYRTKGDNNRIEDSAVVQNDNIFGKVILKIPKLGYIRDFLNKPFGFILFIFLPILLIVIINLKSMKEKE